MSLAYREHLPGARLEPWVECCWTSFCDTPLSGHAVRPDGCLDILWTPAEGARVVGAMTVEQRFDLAPGVAGIGIRFRPGMAGPFLGVAPAELTDRTVPLADLAGSLARRIESQCWETQSVARILGALAPPAAAPNPVQRAIAAMAAAHGDIDLDWLAGNAGLSPRQFRRRCLEESGLTPKHLCRILRFRRACDLAFAGEPWAGVAADAGYCDQSHLIRDFREFTRSAPMSVFSNTRAAFAG